MQERTSLACGKPMFEQYFDQLEKEYEAIHSDPENTQRLEELHFQITGMLGKNNRNILREYTDRLIAEYSEDPEWFYRRGIRDERTLLSSKAANG